MTATDTTTLELKQSRQARSIQNDGRSTMINGTKASLLKFKDRLFAKTSSLKKRIILLEEILERERTATFVFHRDVLTLEQRYKQLREETDRLYLQSHVDSVTDCLTPLGALRQITNSAFMTSRTNPGNDELRWVVIAVTLEGDLTANSDEALRSVAQLLRLHFKRGGDFIIRFKHRFFIFLAAADLNGVIKRVESDLLPKLFPWAMKFDERLSVSEARIGATEMTLPCSFCYDGGHRSQHEVRTAFEHALKAAISEPTREWNTINIYR